MSDSSICDSSARDVRTGLGRRFIKMIGAVLAVGAALLAIASPTPASAAVVLIDNFNSTTSLWPFTVNTSFGTQSGNENGLSGVVGGSRRTFVGAGALDVSGLDSLAASVAFGAFDLNLSVGARGGVDLEYGTFVTGGSSLNLDFTTQLGIEIVFSAFDPPSTSPGTPATVGIILHDDARALDVGTIIVPILTSGAQTVFIPFTGIALPDLAQVDGLSFDFTTPDGTDFRIDTIQTVVPEPALGSAMMLGALALLAPRRRQK